MNLGKEPSLDGRLETIERRLGRIEQLINVVLEKQASLSANSEKAILFGLQHAEGRIERSFEDATNELLAEMRWQSEAKG